MKYAFVVIVFALSVLLFSCAKSPTGEIVMQSSTLTAGVEQAAPANTAIAEKVPSSVEKVEIIHFHGTHQCSSCIAVGDLADETVETYFKAELLTGKVTFQHINGELPENKALVEKYGVTSASLWIGVYDKDGFHKEQNMNVWYKISNKEEYMVYLSGIIDKRLAGDYS